MLRRTNLARVLFVGTTLVVCSHAFHAAPVWTDTPQGAADAPKGLHISDDEFEGSPVFTDFFSYHRRALEASASAQNFGRHQEMWSLPPATPPAPALLSQEEHGRARRFPTAPPTTTEPDDVDALPTIAPTTLLPAPTSPSVYRYPDCKDEAPRGCHPGWAPCCPLGSGKATGISCQSSNCDPERDVRAGEKCFGGWMKKNCANTCGLCVEGECTWWGKDSGLDHVFTCVDGVQCNTETHKLGPLCCKNHGGKGQCSKNEPFMCANPQSCGFGLEHCCVAHPDDCNRSRRGGVRTCRGEADPRLTAGGTTAPPAATTQSPGESRKECESKCAAQQLVQQNSAVCHEVLPIEFASLCYVRCNGYPENAFVECDSRLDPCIKPYQRHFGIVDSNDLSSADATSLNPEFASQATSPEDCARDCLKMPNGKCKSFVYIADIEDADADAAHCLLKAGEMLADGYRLVKREGAVYYHRVKFQCRVFPETTTSTPTSTSSTRARATYTMTTTPTTTQDLGSGDIVADDDERETTTATSTATSTPIEAPSSTVTTVTATSTSTTTSYTSTTTTAATETTTTIASSITTTTTVSSTTATVSSTTTTVSSATTTTISSTTVSSTTTSGSVTTATTTMSLKTTTSTTTTATSTTTTITITTQTTTTVSTTTAATVTATATATATATSRTKTDTATTTTTAPTTTPPSSASTTTSTATAAFPAPNSSTASIPTQTGVATTPVGATSTGGSISATTATNTSTATTYHTTSNPVPSFNSTTSAYINTTATPVSTNATSIRSTVTRATSTVSIPTTITSTSTTSIQTNSSTTTTTTTTSSTATTLERTSAPTSAPTTTTTTTVTYTALTSPVATTKAPESTATVETFASQSSWVTTSRSPDATPLSAGNDTDSGANESSSDASSGDHDMNKDTKQKVPTGVLVLLAILAILLVVVFFILKSEGAKKTLIQLYRPSDATGQQKPENIEMNPTVTSKRSSANEDGADIAGQQVVLAPYSTPYTSSPNTENEGGDHEVAISLLESHAYQLDDFEYDEDPLGGTWATNLRHNAETRFPSLDEVPEAHVTTKTTAVIESKRKDSSVLLGSAQRLELLPPKVREVDDQPRAPEQLELQFGRLDGSRSTNITETIV